jgi:uncharacterized repeat protein (TIGR03943 family)
MKAQNRRILFSLTVMVWSAVLLYFYGSGRVDKYLATDFRPLSLVGGLGLAVLGLFNFLTSGREVDCGHQYENECEPHHHDDGEMHPFIVVLLMTVPVLLSVAWTKDEYSLAALSRKGLYSAPVAKASAAPSSSRSALTLEDLEKSRRKTADGYLPFDLLEIFYATGDRELQSVMDGLKVETVGRWMDEKVRNPDGKRKRLYRVFITCCAADSSVIPIILEFGKPAPEFPENSWVKVNGIIRFPLEDGALQPVLMVEHVDESKAPAEENFMRE